MRRIIHLSDLHFGRIHYPLMGSLTTLIKDIAPDLIAVSGDLTQRARSHQFQEARHFLDDLPFPQIVVPGNHDIPLYNVWARFAKPLCKYRKYITGELQPFFSDDEIVAVGINTARSLTRKYGRINKRQIEQLSQRLRPFGDSVTKIVITHHPFDLPEGYRDKRQLVGRARLAMKELSACGVDLLLSGHLHLVHTSVTATRYKITGHSALVVQAGTATSTRGRGESNSFNVLETRPGEITVQRMTWNPADVNFARSSVSRYERVDKGWQEVEREVAHSR